MHTPAPWVYDDTLEHYPHPVIRNNGRLVCHFNLFDRRRSADARLIVDSVNALADAGITNPGALGEALDALRAAVAAYDATGDVHPHGPHLRAALAALTEEE